MRRAAAALIVLGAAACTPAIHPMGPPVGPPALAGDAIVAPDGVRLPLRRWLPEGRPNAVILALHGFNDYSNAFTGPGEFWVQRGIATYAYDQRGFGAAPKRGRWPGQDTLVADLKAALAAVRARHPGVPLYLLGESMGGAVVMNALAGDDPPEVAGAILVAPAVWGFDHMGALPRASLWFFSRTIPWYTLTGQGLRIVATDNTEIARQLARDPMVIKETRFDTIWGLVDMMGNGYAAAQRLKGPVLALYGDKDQIVPDRPIYDMLRQIPETTPLTVAIYADGYHMLLRDLNALSRLQDIADWTADPAMPLPSGADRRGREKLGR